MRSLRALSILFGLAAMACGQALPIDKILEKPPKGVKKIRIVADTIDIRTKDPNLVTTLQYDQEGRLIVSTIGCQDAVTKDWVYFDARGYKYEYDPDGYLATVSDSRIAMNVATEEVVPGSIPQSRWTFEKHEGSTRVVLRQFYDHNGEFLEERDIRWEYDWFDGRLAKVIRRDNFGDERVETYGYYDSFTCNGIFKNKLLKVVTTDRLFCDGAWKEFPVAEDWYSYDWKEKFLSEHLEISSTSGKMVFVHKFDRNGDLIEERSFTAGGVLSRKRVVETKREQTRGLNLKTEERETVYTYHDEDPTSLYLAEKKEGEYVTHYSYVFWEE